MSQMRQDAGVLAVPAPALVEGRGHAGQQQGGGGDDEGGAVERRRRVERDESPAARTERQAHHDEAEGREQPVVERHRHGADEQALGPFMPPPSSANLRARGPRRTAGRSTDQRSGKVQKAAMTGRNTVAPSWAGVM